MNRYSEGDSLFTTRRIIYTARRYSGKAENTQGNKESRLIDAQETNKIARRKESLSSVFERKGSIGQEGSVSIVTQAIFKEKDRENEGIVKEGRADAREIEQTHRKRKRDGGEIREITKFKWSSGEIKKSAISIFDTDIQAYVYFPCFFEDSEDSNFVISGEYTEDDCPTSPCQRKYCQEYLGKELEEAIITA